MQGNGLNIFLPYPLEINGIISYWLIEFLIFKGDLNLYVEYL